MRTPWRVSWQTRRWVGLVGPDGTGGHKADGKDGKDAQKKVRFCGGRSSWGVAMQHG